MACSMLKLETRVWHTYKCQNSTSVFSVYIHSWIEFKLTLMVHACMHVCMCNECICVCCHYMYAKYYYPHCLEMKTCKFSCWYANVWKLNCMSSYITKLTLTWLSAVSPSSLETASQSQSFSSYIVLTFTYVSHLGFHYRKKVWAWCRHKVCTTQRCSA